MNRPRVVIAEDFILIQENIRKAIEPLCEVVAVVEEGAAALQAVATHSPDILLLDVSLPDMTGFNVAEKLLEAKAEVRIIFLTAHSTEQYIDRALELGAKGYVLKGRIWTELPAAIRTIAGGGTHPCRPML